MPTNHFNPRHRRVWLAAAILLALAASTVEAGWPFRSSAPAEDTPRVVLTAQSSWNPFARKPGQKSFLQKTGDSIGGALKSTGNTIKKGASYLNPWRKKPNDAPVTGITERRSKNKNKEKESSGWFSWMRPKPKPQPPQTVNEWLNQDRPEVR